MPLTDARIAQLGRQHEELREEIKKLAARKDAITLKVVTEYRRRRTRLLEARGVKVTMTVPEESWYDWDELSEVLTPRQMRFIQVQKVDKEKLAELVNSGKVDSAAVAGCHHSKEKKAYLSVTLPRGDR